MTGDLPRGFAIREATPNDSALLLEWIRNLAEFEGLEDLVTATPEGIARDFFEKKMSRALFVETGGKTVGFAVWYYNYSTFAGKPGLFLEDIFIAEKYRGKGLATGIFSYLERLAVSEGCSRLEWYVLDWNEKAIAFYLKRGGEPHANWQIFRKYLD
jgi:GNAT superfamily N-acetyltransferase